MVASCRLQNRSIMVFQRHGASYTAYSYTAFKNILFSLPLYKWQVAFSNFIEMREKRFYFRTDSYFGLLSDSDLIWSEHLNTPAQLSLNPSPSQSTWHFSTNRLAADWPVILLICIRPIKSIVLNFSHIPIPATNLHIFFYCTKLALWVTGQG